MYAVSVKGQAFASLLLDLAASALLELLALTISLLYQTFSVTGCR